MNNVHISDDGRSRRRGTLERFIAPLLVLLAGVGLAASSACGSDAAGPATTPAKTPTTVLERLIAAYPDGNVDPSAPAWTALLADEGFDTKPVAIVEFVRLRPEADAAANYVSWPSFAVFTDLRLEPGYIEAQKSRVMSADQYGNLITIAGIDQRPPR